MQKRHALFRILIALISGLLVLQLLSGIALFTLKLGLTPSAIARSYRGDPQTFAAPRTFNGLLETTLPHLASVSLVALILAHFLLFVPSLRPRDKGLLIAGLFGGGAVNILSGHLIVFVSAHFAYLKLGAFFIFESSMLVSLLVIGISAGRHHRRMN